MTQILSDLVDAQEMQKAYTNTFEAPTHDELADVDEGDFVKICRHDERFWVQVIDVIDGIVFGFVANNLIAPDNDELKHGDVVALNLRHIFCIERKEP